MPEDAAVEATMAAGTAETPPSVPAGPDVDESSLDLDGALKEIRSLRAENAARRVKGKEVETELSEFRAWKESQLTELQKAQKAAEAARGEAVDSWRHLAAKEYGVPENLVARIQGSTRDEIFADAKSLAPAAPTDGGQPGVPRGLDLFGGQRGAPVASKSNADDLLRRALRGGK